MFEITADDIAALGDSDLRSLVALLCESEMRRRAKPVSAVTWGGDQNASDGGLDVRVDLPRRTKLQGFVPRAATGFQVKKSDMRSRGIAVEMRPKGKIRAAIRDLAKQSGAYIIVSSNGSVSDLALRKRREAMAAAVKGMTGARALALDFYDRGRVATWVRDNPGLIPWVRQKIGKSIQGWRSYGAWAYAAEDVKATYLLDDMLRIHTGKREGGNGVSAADGLTSIRDVLREPRKAVRIVGLSGVGKTRFVQALFDHRVGKRSLDPSIAIYTNMSDDPDPQPVGLASDMVASGTRAVLVVDNCPPDLHRRLAEVCRSASSLLSLVTIEYDIRDDDPEETDVFRLEPSSVELIEKLVRARFKTISQVDGRTIATFSGGNARIALALAGTVGKNDTLAGLTDAELFERLFQQRHGHDEALLLIAQVTSLVYSFQGEATTGDEAELPIFAAMTGKFVDEIFRGVAALRDRDLVQQRGVWRAVLPHAIANRLAAMALRSIPLETIKAKLIDGGSTRLLRSFSRRLGYLHDNKVAVRIVNEWLSKDGLLGDIANLSDVEMAIFENIAPVDPKAVLAALDRMPPASLSRRDSLAHIIGSIAYDPKLFDRCTELLLRCGAGDDERNTNVDHDRHLTSLFYIILSGTNATIEQRLSVLDSLLRSDDAYRRKVGIKALHNVLEAMHFGSGTDFEFGARPRDYGLWPKTNADVKHWYVSALGLVQSISLSTLPVAPEVRTALASKFRGLWNQPQLRHELDRLCRTITKAGFWREGWTGVRQTLKFDSNGMAKEAKAALVRLEKFLSPKDLVQKVRGIVLATNTHGLDFDDLDIDQDDGGANVLDRLNSIATTLGNDVAHDAAALQELLPELMSVRGAALWSFGRGLAASADDPKAMWGCMVVQFNNSLAEDRNTQIFCGFLEVLSARNMELADTLLDEAVAHEALAAWFPELQRAIIIDKRGVKRLEQSLTLNLVPMYRYRYLAMGRAADPIAAPDLKELLVALASKPNGGFDSAIEILYMRFFSDLQEKKPLDPALIEAGRELIGMFDLTTDRQERDHRIGSVIKTCLTGVGGAKGIEGLCRKLKKAVANREVYAFSQDELLKSLFRAHPDVALEELLGGDDADQKLGCEIIMDASHHRANPLACVPVDVLVAWCERKPSERYPLAASVIPIFTGQQDHPSPSVWSAAALAILDKAPDRVAALRHFVCRFRPRSWSGSGAAAMETRLPLLRQLETHADPDVATFAKADGARLRKEIDQERERETKDDKANDERFE
jgi:hypothetical protein